MHKSTTILLLTFVFFISIKTSITQDFTIDSLSRRCGFDSMMVSFKYIGSGPTPSSFYWNFGNGNTSDRQNPSMEYKQPGNYTVTLITDNTDTIERTEYIQIYSTPDRGYRYDKIENEPSYHIHLQGEIFPVDTADALMFYWSFDDEQQDTVTMPSIIHQYSETGMYKTRLIIQDTLLQCSDTLKQFVFVYDSLEIPNVFTPNNDGINDLFTIRGEEKTDISVWIYNRWGNLIYKDTAPIIIWDGKTVSGMDIEEDIYFYIVHLKKNNTIIEERQGFFHLYR